MLSLEKRTKNIKSNEKCIKTKNIFCYVYVWKYIKITKQVKKYISILLKTG